MKENSIKKEQQEEEYQFPYHYILNYKDDAIDIVKRYNYGFAHYSLIKLIKKIILQKNPESILDIGCGDGKLIYEICRDKTLQNNIKTLIGIDNNGRAIAFAKIFNHNNKAKFLIKDIFNFEHDPFTLVILTEVVEHIPDKEMSKLLDEIFSLVAEGKYLIISVPSINIPLQPKHYRHYDIDSLKKLLKSHFKIEKTYYIGSVSIFSKLFKQIYMLLDDFKIQLLKRYLFSYYKKKFIITSKKKSQHIIVLCKKI